MKKQTNKRRALESISKRNTHKRRSKERAKNELMRAVLETNVGIDALKIGDSLDGGRRSRMSDKIRRDEIFAEGVFSSSKGGFGFVTVEGAERDIFIPEDKTLGALDGDRVEIIYHSYTSRYGEEKTEGRVKRITLPLKKTVVGTLRETHPYRVGRSARVPRYIIEPDDPRLGFELTVTDTAGALPGDKVMALIRRGYSSRDHECSVIRSFGNTYTKEANYEAILAECEIPVDFSEAELCEARFFAAAPISDTGRVRRTETIFTIDGEGAKDLDDAVSLRKLKSGWELGVHIADVSEYVKERSHLDRAVMARGTSVYFTDKVVPMLPKELSNGACSLNPDEDKYTLSAIISLDTDGEIIGVKLEPSIIRSSVRGVYSEVNAIFRGNATDGVREKYKKVLPSLRRMHELYKILYKKSVARGSLELETAEAEIILDGNGYPVDIIKRERGDAEKLIEQFMLTANEAVAKYLSDAQIPCVYRVHEEPPIERLGEFLTYAHNLGFDTSYISREKSEPRDLARLLFAAQEKGLIREISYAMLRSMSKAKYSDVRSAHYGLALKYYCHFTSPIRRLSDLATHRIIHKVLLEDKRPEAYVKYAKRAAAAATDAEIRAVNAERKIENLYKVIYMSDKIGECFDATVSSVASFGFFAELDNTCEGLIPISELPGVFTFDEGNLSLRSRDAVYRVGDSVRVRLEEADIIKGKLRFSVV